MSSEITFDGKKYIPATDAGKYFGYTKEYMLMLIKGGKIDGQKVKHKWFVNIPSAEVYFENAKLARVERRLKLSESRRVELREHVSQVVKEVEVEDVVQVSPYTRHAQLAILETLVIVFLGISVGSFGYVSTSSPVATAHMSERGFLKGLAVYVYDFFSSDADTATPSDRVVVSLPVMTDGNSHSEIQAISARIGTTTHTSLAISADELFTLTTTSVESIEASFSDPVDVAVDPQSPNTAIITPQFRDGKGEEYRFMMVPVEVNTQTP